MSKKSWAKLSESSSAFWKAVENCLKFVFSLSARTRAERSTRLACSPGSGRRGRLCTAGVPVWGMLLILLTGMLGAGTAGAATVETASAAGKRIEAGDCHSLALKSDGTVVAWGWNYYGQCNVPAGLNLAWRLSSLILSRGTLTPDFRPDLNEYSVDVAYDVSAVDITPTLADPAVTTMTVQGVPLASGGTRTVELAPGANPIEIKVICDKVGLTRTYRIIVNRMNPSSDAALSDLKVGGVTVAGFAPETCAYSVQLSYGTRPGDAVAQVTAGARDPRAMVRITQAAALPGTAAVEVTAEDGTTKKTYTVNFTLAAPDKVAAPTATPAGGTVANGTTVTLATTISGATIHYTIDGSTPTASSPSGTSVVISGAAGATVTLKAFAVRAGMTDSDISTFTYMIAETPTDSNPPTWPSGSTLRASGTTRTGTTLSWTAAQDDIGVTGYKIYKNGTELATVTGAVYSYEVTGLSPSTTYAFQVQAGDADGNWSNDGPAVTVKTNSSGEGGSGSESSSSVTVNGSVIDGASGAKVSNLTATVTNDSKGNKTVSMNAAQLVVLKRPDGNTSKLKIVQK